MTNSQSTLVPRPILINPFARRQLYPLTNESFLSSTISTIRKYLAYFLLPFRILGLTVSLTATNIFGRLALLGYSPEYKYNEEFDEMLLEPLPLWRRYMLVPCTLSFRIAMFFIGFHRIRVIGEKPASREEAPILIANHVSPFDPFYICIRHKPMVIARAEQKDTPLFGSLFTASQSILVDRSDKDSRRKTAQEIKRRALDNRFPQILLFPEGTTTNGTALVNFKTGAFLAGVPVQPIVVRYPVDSNTYDLTWTPGVGLVKFMFSAILQLNNTMEVEYLPVYKPSEEEKLDPFLYANNVRQYMADHMNVPVTEHKLEDMLLLDHAMRRNRSFNLPAEMTITDLMQRSSHLRFEKHRNDFFALLNIFQEMDETGESIVDIHKFEKVMLRAFNKDSNLSVAVQSRFLSYTRKLFRLLCNEDGKLDYRTFVLGVGPFLVSPDDVESRHIFFRSAFQAFDQDGDGFISRRELESIMRRINPYLEKERLQELCNVMFSELDADRDEKLNYEEFENGLQTNDYLKGLFDSTRYTLQQLIKDTENPSKKGKESV